MTDTATKFASKAFKMAEARTEKTRKILRRNRQAYIGLHGMAFDQVKTGAEKIRTDRKGVFTSLVEKGEDIEAGVFKFFRGAQDKAEDAAQDSAKRVWTLLPGAKDNRVEALEADLEAAREKLKTVTKKAAKKVPAKAKKSATKVAKSAKKTAKVAVKPVAKAAKPAAVETAVETGSVTAAPVKAETAQSVQPKSAPSKPAQPRHIPYFNDVKRYDPLASEDVVRKIVNHCGIALRSEDARYVACTDEAERNRVRDSWLKKKLAVQGTDADLNKKVQNVCSIMQRDNRKNRVTFYYLAAKAERKLGTL